MLRSRMFIPYSSAARSLAMAATSLQGQGLLLTLPGQITPSLTPDAEHAMRTSVLAVWAMLPKQNALGHDRPTGMDACLR